MKEPAILSLCKYDIAYTMDLMNYIQFFRKLKNFSCSLQAFIFLIDPIFRWSEGAASKLQSCSCCQEKRFSRRSVNLRCLNGDEVPFEYDYVEECGCNNTECKPAGQPSRRRRSFS